MPIKFPCACGRQIEVLDALAGKPHACPQCGTKNIVPDDPGAPASAAGAGDPASHGKQCYQCKAPLPAKATTCVRCGWDSAQIRRLCLACGEWVLLSANLPTSPVVAVPVGVLALAAGLFGGCIGALAAGLGIGAIASVISAMTVAHRCRACKQPVPPSLLSPEELDEVRGKRLMHWLAAGALGLAALVFAVIWVIVIVTAVKAALNQQPPPGF